MEETFTSTNQEQDVQTFLTATTGKPIHRVQKMHSKEKKIWLSNQAPLLGEINQVDTTKGHQYLTYDFSAWIHTLQS